MSRMLKALRQLESVPQQSPAPNRSAGHAVPSPRSVPESAPSFPSGSAGPAAQSTASDASTSHEGSPQVAAVAERAPAVENRPVSIVIVPVEESASGQPDSQPEDRMTLTLDQLLASMSKEADRSGAAKPQPEVAASTVEPQAAATPASDKPHVVVAPALAQPETPAIPPAPAIMEPALSDSVPAEGFATADIATPPDSMEADPYQAIVQVMLAQLHGPCPLILLASCEASTALACVAEPLAGALGDHVGAAVLLAEASDLADSQDWPATLAQWRVGHRAVFIVGPANDAASAARLAACCDGTYLILRAGQTLRKSAAKTVAQLESAGGHVLGCLLVARQ